ncbi:hypothetical protein FACS1894104_2050 [Actinomycetota bacterium]|nr:hypothetical protein FACS1894104_2050 [Actinomycetota bacterium]
MWLRTIEANMYGMTTATGIDDPLQTAMPGVYQFAVAVQNTVTGPIGYTILGFCVLVTIYETLTKNNEFLAGQKVYEAIVISLVGLIILKVVIDHAGAIMTFVFWAFNQVTVGINSVQSPTPSSVIYGAGWIDSTIADLKSNGQGIAFMLPCFLAMIVSLLASLAARIILLARFIELYAMLALSPLPLATLASERFSDIGKSFLKSFIAVVLQAAVVLLVIRFFPVMLAGAPMASGGDIMNLIVTPIVYSVVILVAVVGSGQLAKKIVGQG